MSRKHRDQNTLIAGGELEIVPDVPIMGLLVKIVPKSDPVRTSALHHFNFPQR